MQSVRLAPVVRSFAVGHLLALTLLLPSLVVAQHAGHGEARGAPAVPLPPADGERLGTLRFATSASPAANAAFERGVLYLHNFHYPQALDAFRRARALDARDVVSAAFEALAHTHPVWNQQDTAAARAALRSLGPTRTARLALARTPRERAWLDAVETLYEGDTPKAVRDTAFSRALAHLHESDPSDPEAATFYALSLLGLNQGDREPRAYAAAEAIADSVLRTHPQHPGALHYKIHAVDDPANAARGIDAAATYGELATSASHAQHMTSHIFIALGRWDDVVRANLRSHLAQAPALYSFGHGTHWLAYAYVQQGKVREARGWLDSMLTYRRAVADGRRPAVRGRADTEVHAVLMTAAHVLDTDAWDSPLAVMRFDTTYLRGLHAQSIADFFVGVAAARRAGRPVDLTPGSRAADRLLVDSMLARITSRNAAARTAGARASVTGQAEVMELMLRGERHLMLARPDSAVALMRRAAEKLETLPFEFGPPVTGKPPRERAAEILLRTRKPAEALAELELAEHMAPGRTRARHARAAALLALDRREDAVAEYRALAEAWRDADVTFPYREEALWGSTVLAEPGPDAVTAVDTVEYASGPLALRGIVYRPRAAGRHPGLVVLHGSGGTYRRDDADIIGRLFASHGYATFFPDRRGLGLSAGQGIAILDQLQQEGLLERDSAYAARSTELLLGRELDDVRAAVAAFRARADVDPTRVAVTGTSYGGILTLLVAEVDTTLRAAVAFAPAAMNWGWNAPLRARLSAGARRTRVPVLILQAENDWNIAPAQELPAAIRAGGGVGEGKLYPPVGGSANEGHGLMNLTATLWQDDVLAFLARHVRR